MVVKKHIYWNEETEWLKNALASAGAFLVANSPAGGLPNPMTIGWGQVGIVWGCPVFTAFVRKSRFTYECLQSADSFTVNVPRPGELADKLMACGTRSGRDINKMEAFELTAEPAEIVDTPIISECGLHYECKILVRSQLKTPDIVSTDVLGMYESKDLHQMVLGEIVSVYVTDPQ